MGETMNILGLHFHEWSKWEPTLLQSSFPLLEVFGHNTKTVVPGQKRYCSDCGLEAIRKISGF